MNDQICIRDLEVFYHVGVSDDERSKQQRLLLTLEIESDFTKASAKDDLTQTIDYFAVTQRLLKLGEGREWKLIETLAVEIAELTRNEFGALAVMVEIKKFIIPEARWVSVRVSR
jgi:dihydroneopterin aldolase